MSWRSSPTRQHSCAWPPPWSSKPTTNGKSPAATSPMSPWTNYGPLSPLNTPLQHLPNNTKSPSVQHDSLITTREPRQIRSPPLPGTLSLPGGYQKTALLEADPTLLDLMTDLSENARSFVQAVAGITTVFGLVGKNTATKTAFVAI